MKLIAQPMNYVRVGSYFLFLSLAVTLGSLFLLKAKLSSHHQHILDHTRALIPAERLKSSLEGFVASERGFLLTGDPDFLERLSVADEGFQKHLSELREWIRSARGQEFLADVVAAENDHRAAVNNIHALRRSRGLNDSIVGVFQKEVLPRRLVLQNAVDTLLQYKELELVRIEQAAQLASGQTVWAIIISTGVSILLLGFLSLFFSRKLVRLYDDAKASEEKIRILAGELSRSNAELEKFASIASHDLRSPLNTISNFGILLQRRIGKSGDAEVQDYVRFIVEGATKMRELVDGLLDYARVNNEVGLDDQINLNEVLEEVKVLLRKEIENSGARIVHGQMPEINAARIHLRQLFSNLIGNAIHYQRDERPIIRIDVVDEGAHWKFVIADNGIGIDMKYAERIFEPFKRLHSYQERPGTGLGLPICRSVIERYGGKIWFSSVVGKGTEFYFTLPKVAEWKADVG